jgi:hypothetical protein
MAVATPTSTYSAGGHESVADRLRTHGLAPVIAWLLLTALAAAAVFGADLSRWWFVGFVILGGPIIVGSFVASASRRAL